MSEKLPPMPWAYDEPNHDIVDAGGHLIWLMDHADFVVMAANWHYALLDGLERIAALGNSQPEAAKMAREAIHNALAGKAK